jgi:hypothetical protein
MGSHGVYSGDRVAHGFFGEANRARLHDAIVEGARRESGGTVNIGRQSDQELRAIMYAIYQREARFDPDDVAAQVRALNGSVLAFCVEQVLREARSHAHYLATSAPERREIMPHASMTSTAGQRTETSSSIREWIRPS